MKTLGGKRLHRVKRAVKIQQKKKIQLVSPPCFPHKINNFFNIKNFISSVNFNTTE